MARRVVDVLCPDGTLATEGEQHTVRRFTLAPRTDGTWSVDGQLTGPVGARLFAALSPLAAPRPDDPSGADDRAPGQRCHDALDDAVGRILRDGSPAGTGMPAAVVLTASVGDWASDTGFVTTSTGQLIPVQGAKRITDGGCDVYRATTTSGGAVLDLHRTRRLATTAQTVALTVRDGGCSFPGCDHPPEWCERHHVVPWHQGGPTNLDNLTLLCGYHHRVFEERGWHCRIAELGVPEWIPPAWIDRSQHPLVHQRILTRQQMSTIVR